MHSPIVVPDDTVHAFVGTPALLVAGARTGPLAGYTLAVKDLFDVTGTVTGAGNPSFAAGRPAATDNAVSVQALVDAGASVVGKTITDELAYSLNGTNVHFGTPINVSAPGRIPGGSSAGSAAAVAAGLVDLALGTDTGGSVRVPASYCGIVGWRPTHGAISLDGVVPLAPAFDTVGILCRTATTLRAAADVLLHATTGDVSPIRSLHVLGETDEDAADDVSGALHAVAASIGADTEPWHLGCDLAEAMAAFRALQGREAWTTHGAWIRATRPTFGPGIAARFETASQVTDREVADAHIVRQRVRALVLQATADGRVLLVPGAAGPAPTALNDRARLELQRQRTLRLTCLAGLAGVPVVVTPLASVEGLPLGIGLIGAPGSDRQLIAEAARVMSLA